MNKEYDVVILGSGASGMMSAITAYENGSSVGLFEKQSLVCLLYTSPSPRDATLSRMPSSA